MLENEFDNQFESMMRDKLNQKEFEFRESYWNDAKKLIKNDRSNKFKGIFISMASLLSIIGISAAIIVTVPKQMTFNSNKELINNESEIMLKPQ